MKLSYIYAFLILLSIPLLTNSKELKSFVQILKKYTTSDIVSLISECKTKNYKIIDPDDYLKKEDEEALEKQLKEIYAGHNVVTIIVVVRNLDLTDNNQKKIDISNYTEIVLDEIYSKKIVKKESSIVLALVSIEGKIMTMKAYGQVGYTITQQDCYNILNIINNYYSYGEYSYGTVELSKLIKYYLVNTSFFSRNKRFFIMLIILFSSFVFCYILAIVAQKIREKRNLRLTMSDEQKLIKIRDFLKRCKADKEILSDNCIICLEPFDNCKSLNHSSMKEPNNENNENNKDINNNREGLILEENEDKKDKESISIEMQNMSQEEGANNKSNLSDNQISTLPCGHKYHTKCITEWMLRKKSICPMCREKMDVSISDKSEDDDLQNELLNIQIELHPAFALLVFQTINEELTWGAMALPAINGGLFAGLGGFAFI